MNLYRPGIGISILSWNIAPEATWPTISRSAAESRLWNTSHPKEPLPSTILILEQVVLMKLLFEVS